MLSAQLLRFEIWKRNQKHQYDEEALIGGNGWNVIWFKCEQDPILVQVWIQVPLA